MEENKLCPFKKKTYITDYHWEGQNPLPYIYEEEFMPCLKKECMAWFECCLYGGEIIAQGCSLMQSKKIL